MELSEGQLEQIEQFARDCYREQDLTHNIEHMERTIRLALFLASREHAEKEVVLLGAMLHQFHDNVDKLEPFLEDQGIETKMIERILECISFRPHKQKTDRDASLEARVVYDADALQVLGPSGLLREVCCNIKARGKPFRQSVEDARNVEAAFYEALQTETARTLIQKPRQLMKSFWKTYDLWSESDFPPG